MAASRGSTRELASAAKCMMSAPAIQPFSGGDGENSHVNGNWKLGASASSASLHSCYRDVFHHVRKLTVQIWCMYFRQNPNTKLPIPLARQSPFTCVQHVQLGTHPQQSTVHRSSRRRGLCQQFVDLWSQQELISNRDNKRKT
jgi:hypothetical protein